MYRKDNLTGLHERDYLYAKYDEFKSNDTKAILIDFRHLKHINDNHGHMIGDQILKFFANQLSIMFTDSVITRLGGDEFFVMTNFSNEEIISKLEKLSKEIKNSFNTKIKSGFYPFNSGISKAMQTFDMTYTRIDLAMYDAKEKDDLYSYFEQDMLDKMYFEKEFVEYIEKIINERKFNYQERQIDDELVDLTLLDPYYAKIFTKEKSEILKKHNLISALDYHSVYNACENILDNEQSFMINIYQETLMGEHRFVNFLQNMIIKNGLDRSKLCINVSTMDYYGKAEDLVLKINELKQLGIKVSIGNINLNNQQYLLPILAFCDIDYVKVDGDVFNEALSNKKVLTVVDGIIKILKKQNIKPILINLEEKDYESEFVVKNKILVRKK